jgi:hypothetical protein
MKKTAILLFIAIALVAATAITVTAVPANVCHGVVKDRDLRTPVNGATCTLVENGWYVSTDANGIFYLNLQGALASGTYHLQVSKTDYVTQTITFYYDSSNISGTNLGTIWLLEQ